MYSLLIFLLSAVVISLSGVMAPGPMTAAALAAGTKNRHAGMLLAIGHGIVEFPLMLLILAGMGKIFEFEAVKISIGFFGGAFLVFMGTAMLRDVKKSINPIIPNHRNGNIVTGIMMTGANPYFLLWWATVGLTLTTNALNFSLLAFALFAIIHWLCDLVWLETLSIASFKGSKLISQRSQQLVLTVCGAALLFFAVMFIWDAGTKLIAR